MSKNHRRAISRFFPKGHPKEGQPTYFVEQIWNSLHNARIEHLPNIYSIIQLNRASIESDQTKLTAAHVYEYWETVRYDYHSDQIGEKHHTIRARQQVNVGDTIQLFVWVDKPYCSPQILVTPPIPVVNTWIFHTEIFEGNMYGFINDIIVPASGAAVLAQNDGLLLPDFEKWICRHPKLVKNLFDGQIICWNPNISY